MRHLITIILVVCMALTSSSPLSAAGSDEWQKLNDQTLDFYKQQKFTKASGAGRQAVASARELPEAERGKLAASLGNLAMIYTHLGKFAEAEELAKEELLEVSNRIAALQPPTN